MASIPPSSPPSPPIKFPNSGFVVLDPKDKIEEKTPFYKPERYPVHIGEVFKSTYSIQVPVDQASSQTSFFEGLGHAKRAITRLRISS